MISRTRTRVVAAGAAALAAASAALSGGTATAAPQGAVQPQAVAGGVILGGADGKPRTLMCPAEENVMSGGFTVSADAGHKLGPDPADLLESRPTADATGWVIAVRKLQLADAKEKAKPANLVVHVVCTQGENTPGG